MIIFFRKGGGEGIVQAIQSYKCYVKFFLTFYKHVTDRKQITENKKYHKTTTE